MRFNAHEFRNDEFCAKTGRVETYLAPDIETAVQRCLYTKRLIDGGARIGFGGGVIYTRDHIYSMVKE